MYLGSHRREHWTLGAESDSRLNQQHYDNRHALVDSTEVKTQITVIPIY